MLTMVVVPAGMDNTETNPATSDFLESYQLTWQTNQGLFTNKALQNLSKHSISTGTNIGDVESAAQLVVYNGSYNSNLISNYSFKEWEARSESFALSRGPNVSSEMLDMDLEVENLTYVIETDLSITYEDKPESKVLNRSFKTSKGLQNVKDPYLVSRGYNAEFNNCGLNSPVSESLTIATADYNGTGYGEAAVMPEMSEISDPTERVLVTSDVSNYSTSDTSGFAAVITNQSTVSSSYNTVYASNVNISEIGEGESLIVHEGEVYHSYFREIMDKSCYLSVEGYPGVEERFSDETQSYNGSVATFINESQISTNSSKSSVGYEYFNGAGTLEEVAGVSYGKGETLSWFRISQSISQALGIEEITN